MALRYSDILSIGTLVNFKGEFWKNFEPAIVAHVDKNDETYTFIRWKNATEKHAIKLTEIYIDNMIVNQSNGTLNITFTIDHNGSHTIYREDSRKMDDFKRYEKLLANLPNGLPNGLI